MAGSRKGDGGSRPVKINRLLGSVFDSRKWRSRVELHRVFEFWDNVVGKEIGAVAQPSLIRGRVLWVRVKDSVWMQHLHLQKILVLEKINREFGDDNRLEDIHFQLDSSLAPPPEPEPERPEPQPLDKQQEKEFDRLISSLENDDLRVSLKSLWKTMKTKGR